MNLIEMPKLNIGHLQAKLPIIQGGMGVRISLSKLASAVANAGAIGVISAAAIGISEPDAATHFPLANKRALTYEIRQSRELTSGIIGVNIMVALSDYDDLLTIAYDEKVDLVFAGAGLPLKIPKTISHDKLTNGPTKFVPIVSSAKATNIIFKYWQKKYNHVPDAVVVEGPLAGGHLGYSADKIDDPKNALETIISEVIPVVKKYSGLFNKEIPVIAAGGIYTGADIKKYLKMGAQGVQMGTRFVTTEECDASLKFKEAYINCKKEDITLIDSPVGLPGRAINNMFLDRIAKGHKEKFICPFRCLRSCNFKEASYCIARALDNAQIGNLDSGFAFAGANAYKTDKIVSVQTLMNSLVEEFKA